MPLFREQIRKGGPVTVTHKDVIRYFMTIPEAVQLVLQAGSMGKGGDVFVLDMGKPVRIADLAKRIISLMSLTVRDDENPTATSRSCTSPDDPSGALTRFDCDRARNLLMQTVAEYRPTGDIQRTSRHCKRGARRTSGRLPQSTSTSAKPQRPVRAFSAAVEIVQAPLAMAPRSAASRAVTSRPVSRIAAFVLRTSMGDGRLGTPDDCSACDASAWRSTAWLIVAALVSSTAMG